MWTLIAGVFMGWAMGGNNAADLIGPVVESKALRFWIAASVASAFVIIGALMVGSRGFATYGAIGAQTIISSFIVMLASALTVTLMTVFCTKKVINYEISLWGNFARFQWNYNCGYIQHVLR